MIQAHLLFSGRVQGVGFRYTFQRLAIQLKIAGWVKNLADGRVEAMIEASEDNVHEICRLIVEQFPNNKISIVRQDSPATGRLSDFHIAF